MPQFARPDLDTTIGEYSDQAGGTTNIYTTIDESSPNDADYIRSAAHNAGFGTAWYVSRLSDITDPVSSSGHVMRFRYSTDLDNQEPVDFTQQLRQGYVSEVSLGTLIASIQVLSVQSTTWTTNVYTLSGAEADAITNYTDLFFRFGLEWT